MDSAAAVETKLVKLRRTATGYSVPLYFPRPWSTPETLPDVKHVQHMFIPNRNLS